MKPITDDFVAELMDDVAAREKRVRLVGIKKRARANQKSKKPIRFDVRKLKRAKKTISGVYCYVSRLGSVS